MRDKASNLTPAEYERAIACIVDLERDIAFYEGKKDASLMRIEEYIKGVDDAFLATALRLKYVDGVPWLKLAIMLEYGSPKALEMLIRRYVCRASKKK